jgi:hypothetical protein
MQATAHRQAGTPACAHRGVCARRTRDPGLLPAVIIALLALVVTVGLHVFDGAPDGQVALFFPAAMSDDDALRAIVVADGLPVRVGRSALSDGKVWIAQGDAGFPAAARRAGAWLAINPYAFGGCLIR